MSYEIICPYCFKTMKDDEVHFRSEKVNQGIPDFLPDDYDDLDDFSRRYNGADKEDILNQYRDWDFFGAREDAQYKAFWDAFGGTTENNPADRLLGIPSARRKVIDPTSTDHQRYLRRQQDGTFFIRDGNGMVTQIELSTGEKCDRRVCRYCHNPLPSNYGKNQVKFATIVGITGAGKTVYLSQLLRKIKTYSAQVGLSAVVTAPSSLNFLETNAVEAGKQLPGSTPVKQLQQPLFYDMIRSVDEHTKSTETFVLYDVAGEIFDEKYQGDLIRKFARFIEHSDGIILLIDPNQMQAISGIRQNGKTLADPATALSAIHNIVSHGQTDRKSTIPIAVCMSKADDESVQRALSEELRSRLLSDVTGIRGKRLYEPIFNAEEYVPITEGLEDFYLSYPDTLALANLLDTSYETYDYFAFTALGCEVEEITDEQGAKISTPVGPVLPKRVEEPLFWLFYKLGYIQANRRLPREIYCPVCGKLDNEPMPEGSFITEKRGFFRKAVQIPVNRHCRSCGHEWMNE